MSNHRRKGYLNYIQFIPQREQCATIRKAASNGVVHELKRIIFGFDP
jgi:hypothetical protein